MPEGQDYNQNQIQKHHHSHSLKFFQWQVSFSHWLDCTIKRKELMALVNEPQPQAQAQQSKT